MFVAFTYGLAIPILFPIVVFALVNILIMERIQFAYFYRSPQYMDIQMNDRALVILNRAPVFMMGFGYWLMTNR